MIKLRFLLCFVSASVFLFAGFAAAQTAAPAARIVARIDASQLVTLKGNTNPHANAANDRGAVAADFAMPDLTLVLSRGAQQEAAFETYIASEYDSASPNYHHWLTPQQIGEQYGPAVADVAKVTNWLASQGFTLQSVAPDRMTIRFSGTAGQVASAFHTQIHNLSVHGVAHIGNMSDPQIPAALAPVVVGVKSLHNFLPHPLHRRVGMVQFNSASGRWQRLAATAAAAASSSSGAATNAAPATTANLSSSPRPQFGINVPSTSSSSAYLEEDVTPWDFATIYNVKPAWSAGTTGSGQTIAIAGTSLIAQSNVGSTAYSGTGAVRSVSGNDVATFRSTFGLPSLAGFEQIDTGASGTTATECTSTSASAVCGIGDLDENSLDVEWAGAVATGANLVLVVTGQNSAGTVDTVYDSAYYVVQNHIANILNVSYGLCELYQGTAQNVAFYDLWQSAAAEGIAVFVAAGDSGAPACDQGGDSVGWPYSAQYGLSVSGLASTPYNVAVGGTDFSWCQPVIDSSGNTTGCPSSTSSQGSNAYWSSSSTSGNSSEPYESAKGYVPEIPWNDTCLNPIMGNYLSSVLNYFGYPGGSNAEATCNSIQKNWSSLDNYYYNNYGSDLILATYIDTIGGSGGASNCVANDGADVSSCTTNAGTSTTGASNGNIPTYNDGWVKPSWQTSAEGTVGVPDDGVRDLPDVSFFAADGALQSAYLACISADGACTYSSSSVTTYEEFGGTSIASPAMAGVMALIDQKAGGAQGLPLAELYTLAGQQTYSSCSAEGPPSSTCYFHSIDQGTNAMPCDLGATIGGVNYQKGWYNSQVYSGIDSPNCTTVNSGDTVGTLTGYKAAAGYTMATGLGSLNVANVVNAWTANTVGTATATVTAQLSASSISANQALTVLVTVAGTSGGSTPTGSIVVTGGGYNSTQALASGSASFTIPANSLSPGAVTLTVYYSGDATYAAQSTAAAVTVSAVTPTVTIVAPADDNAANAIPVTVTVSGPSGATTPTGTVTLTGGSFHSAAVALSSTGVASFTIPVGDLPVGADTLTASYSGSTSYYTSATGTFPIAIVSATTVTPTVTVTPGATSIQSGQSLAVTITVTGSSTVPTGNVTLTGTGGYSFGPALLSGGSFALPAPGIPGGTFSAGTVTLTAAYSGDAVYAAGSGSHTVTVTQSTYTLAATSPSSISPGSTATSAITGSSSTGYTGTVALNACTLTSSPSGAVSQPTCSVSGSIAFASGTPSGTGTATVTTYAATTGALVHPRLPGGRNWLGIGSGALLALLVFFGIPARRRGWQTMLSLFVVLLALGGMVSCGSGVASGGGGVASGGGGGSGTPATTAGHYTFTVQGTGNDPASTQETATFTVTVQ